MKLSTRARALLAALALALCASLGVATANPAAASYGTVKVYNFGNTGIGIETDWNGTLYDYILPVNWWSPQNAKGAFTGSCWKTDVYYGYSDPGPYANQATWYYKWSVTGPTQMSFPGWQVTWVGVYSYRYC